MALAVFDFADSLAYWSRSQASRSRISGRDRWLRTARRCSAEAPLISRSIANSASIRLTASMAIGPCCSSASSKKPRRPCAQQPASVIGPGRRSVLYSRPKPEKASACMVPVQPARKRSACTPLRSGE